jgi:transcriptional regulator with XRE-family HTH domain
MRVKEKAEAIRLRREEGLSLNEIMTITGISKGTASMWLRDVELTEEQRERLRLLNPALNGVAKGSLRNAEIWK